MSVKNNFLFFCFFFFSICLAKIPEIQLPLKSKKEIQLFDFTSKKLHFGFFLGPNLSYYRISQKSPFFLNGENLLKIQQQTNFGLSVGILGEWHFYRFLSLRFLPDFSLERKNLLFVFAKDTEVQKLQSTLFRFPFLIRFSSMRLGNFAVNLNLGAGFGVDITNQKKNPDWVYTTQLPFFIAFGIGFDFFLEFFKLGIEIRSEIDVFNGLENNATPFYNAFEKLKTGGIKILISFEG